MIDFIANVAEILKTLAPFASDRLDDVGAEYVAKYLARFNLNPVDPVGPSEVIKAVSDAQQTLGVGVDGWAGELTLKAMQHTPRCGCSDIQRAGTGINQWLARKARGEGISYHVVKYVDGLPPAEQEEIYKAAFESWEAECGVVVRRVRSEQADIIITASSSRQQGLGTIGNTLAYAYLPNGSQHVSQLLMVMDLAEIWLRLGQSGRGVFMQAVAAHEIGHLWGLDHTTMAGQLLRATYDPNIWLPQRGYDIEQGRLRYGESQFVPAPAPPMPPAPPVPPAMPTGDVRMPDGSVWRMTKVSA